MHIPKYMSTIFSNNSPRNISHFDLGCVIFFFNYKPNNVSIEDS